MKQTKRFLGLIAAALLTTGAWAQMTFTYSVDVTESELADGSTLVQLNAGADLNGGFITGAKVGGQAVNLSDITPNPAETFITDGEIETFVYGGKAYSFRFLAGEYFTAVIFSDPHVEQTSYGGLTVANEQTFVSNICNMGKEGGKVVTFSKAPKGYVPTADIVFCLGDMDKDSESEGTNFTTAMQGFNDAGIPFITMAGNHDLVPDYWTGTDPDYGLTSGSTGGSACNDKALSIIANQWAKAAQFGGFTVTTIKDGTSHTQANPFVFEYKGVQFYCGQTYWFQKPYSGSYTVLAGSVLSSATYYAADGVIDALETYVKANTAKPAVWMQHYPFVYGSDCDRWWLDQNDTGMFLAPTDAASSAYYTSTAAYNAEGGNPDAKAKKDKLAEIIKLTKSNTETGEHFHFSGHVHSNATNTYNGVTDKTIGQPGKTYVLLCKEGVGVVEIQEVSFY
ncbi:MAG: metallophosphoesterase [Bacteroidaceae bacterium]|nr:metallophosphoesterase [Bacteroidaceae bacterium]